MRVARSPRRPHAVFIALFYLALGAFALSLLLALVYGDPGHPPRPGLNLDPQGLILEPSGVVYIPERNTLVVVGDEGQLVEMTLEGEFLRMRPLGGDLEGVTLIPDRRLLLVLDEAAEALWLVGLNDFDDLGKISLDTMLTQAGLPAQKRHGMEGVAYDPARDELWLSHQRRPAMLMRCRFQPRAREVALLETRAVPVSEISDLSIHPHSGNLLVASDDDKRLVELNQDGEVVAAWSLPGINPEGVAILPDGRVVIADDIGGVWLHESLPAH